MLKGRVLAGQRGRAIIDAIPCFERAVQLDPELVEAWALLGDSYRLINIYGMAPAEATILPARRALDRALALDPENARAVCTLANIAATYDRDVERSVALSDGLLARDPNDVQAMVERAIILTSAHDDRRRSGSTSACATSRGRGARSAERVGGGDPGARRSRTSGGSTTRSTRRARRWSWTTTGSPDGGRWCGCSPRSAATTRRSRRPTTRSRCRGGIRASCRSWRRSTRAAASVEPVRGILAELHERAAKGFVEHTVLGAVHACLGEMAEARRLVALGIEQHEMWWQFANSPAWAPFRADAEGAGMLRRYGFA